MKLMSKKLRLNEVFPQWMIGYGVFYYLNETLDLPWVTQSNDYVDALNLDYHGNHSGQKKVSPMLQYVAGREDYTLDSIMAPINRLIAVRFLDKWNREFETLSLEYNPIENYSMTETMRGDERITAYGRTNTRTDDLSHTITTNETGETSIEATVTPDTTETVTPDTTVTVTPDTTETVTPNTSQTVTPNTVTTNQRDVCGFNSATASPSETTTETRAGTETTATTGTTTTTREGTETTATTGTTTTTRTGTESTESTGETESTRREVGANTGTVSSVDGGRDVETRNYTLTRSGNIGVTTSQQMLESERAVLLWDYFETVVYPDLDTVLCQPSY